jgi:hypothetical protein
MVGNWTPVFGKFTKTECLRFPYPCMFSGEPFGISELLLIELRIPMILDT